MVETTDRVVELLDNIYQVLVGYYGSEKAKSLYYSDYITIPTGYSATINFSADTRWQIFASELYVDAHEDVAYRWIINGEEYDTNVVRFRKLKKIFQNEENLDLLLQVENNSGATVTLAMYIAGVAEPYQE